MRATYSALRTQPTNLARDHPPKELKLERFREPHAQGLKPKRFGDPTLLSPGPDDFQFGFKRESRHKEPNKSPRLKTFLTILCADFSRVCSCRLSAELRDHYTFRLR